MRTEEDRADKEEPEFLARQEQSEAERKAQEEAATAVAELAAKQETERVARETAAVNIFPATVTDGEEIFSFYSLAP